MAENEGKFSGCNRQIHLRSWILLGFGNITTCLKRMFAAINLEILNQIFPCIGLQVSIFQFKHTQQYKINKDIVTATHPITQICKPFCSKKNKHFYCNILVHQNHYDLPLQEYVHNEKNDFMTKPGEI